VSERNKPRGPLIEVKIVAMQVESPGAMPIAFVFKPPGKDAGPEDGQQMVNDDFIAINLEARLRNINWHSETRNHQAGSSKLRSAFQGGPIGRAEWARETKGCGT
jgi:hypothetical protein